MRYLPLGFKRDELFVVSGIIIVLLVAIVLNLQVSFRKSRDAQRKGDIRNIYNALHSFQNDFSFFPLSDEQGRIMACLDDPSNPQFDELGNVIYEACDYGVDAIRDVFDTSYQPYMANIPEDPLADKGFKYFYISNGKRFQLYASLEGENEAEYDKNIRNRNLSCGVEFCNFGHASGATPLDKSIEAYENELIDLDQN
jgi:type II secretory pathway pseudopilin PulG